jgi:glycogen(starch) synthase
VVRAVVRENIDADVVHGHVGIFGGWVACRLARPGARVFVTEHATFLDLILEQPDARELYEEVVASSAAFFCVSQALRRQLVAAFPHYAGQFHVVPNAVRVDQIAMRPRLVTELRRWLYVGTFTERKGVRWVLESFAVCAIDDPEIELTMVGGGPLFRELRERATQLGLQNRVRIVGAVTPREVTGYLHSHDVLVHLSRFETFGMTIVEAVASGLPVIVTRCGGPEEIMAGIEAIAGELVPVADGVVEVVQAYRRLAQRVPELDPIEARRSMEQRYAYAAVRDQLSELYFGRPPRSVEDR